MSPVGIFCMVSTLENQLEFLYSGQISRDIIIRSHKNTLQLKRMSPAELYGGKAGQSSVHIHAIIQLIAQGEWSQYNYG